MVNGSGRSRQSDLRCCESNFVSKLISYGTYPELCHNLIPFVENLLSKLSIISEVENCMIFGYARVSTASQGRDGNSLQEQLSLLLQHGCQEVIEETYTGRRMDRPKFQELLGRLRPGDTLVVTKLDRFARTVLDGVKTVRDLFDRGVKVHILDMGVVEDSLTGNLILSVMLAFAEYERGMILERTQSGKSVARQDPDFREGRPEKYTPEQRAFAAGMIRKGYTYRQVTAVTGMSRSTIVRAIKGGNNERYKI